jgi:hypothetical protein
VLIFQLSSTTPKPFEGGIVLRLRDQRGEEGRLEFRLQAAIGEPPEGGTPNKLQNKKSSNPGKTENEGILRILPKTVRQAGLILLFVGEVGEAG